MSEWFDEGDMFEFDTLGVGVVVEILGVSEPSRALAHISGEYKLKKAGYTCNVLVEGDLKKIYINVHWYTAGEGQWWWCKHKQEESIPKWHGAKKL